MSRDYDSEEYQALERFGEKYAKKSYEYYEEARQLISDIKYLEETNRRTGYKKRFSLEVIPVGIGADSYWLLKKIITHHHRSWWMEEDNLITFLRIYDIVLGIAGRLLDKDNTVNDEGFQDFIDFEPIYGYYTNGVEYRDSVLSQIYYGCQTDTSELRKRYDEAKSVPEVSA